MKNKIREMYQEVKAIFDSLETYDKSQFHDGRANALNQVLMIFEDCEECEGDEGWLYLGMDELQAHRKGEIK